MRTILAPSVLAADFANLGECIRQAEAAGAEYVHLDVMDGIFVPSISLGFPVISAIRGCTKSIFDIHLMIVDPIRYVQEAADSGADLITFHYEACADEMSVRETLDRIHACGCKAGIAIKPETDADVLIPYLQDADMILVMTVEPGFGGQAYIDACTDKIRRVRALLNERGLSTDIEIDGGIKKDNVLIPMNAGANVIVAGTAVYHGDIHTNVMDFMEIFKSNQ